MINQVKKPKKIKKLLPESYFETQHFEQKLEQRSARKRSDSYSVAPLNSARPYFELNFAPRSAPPHFERNSERRFEPNFATPKTIFSKILEDSFCRNLHSRSDFDAQFELALAYFVAVASFEFATVNCELAIELYCALSVPKRQKN